MALPISSAMKDMTTFLLELELSRFYSEGRIPRLQMAISIRQRKNAIDWRESESKKRIEKTYQEITAKYFQASGTVLKSDWGEMSQAPLIMGIREGKIFLSLRIPEEKNGTIMARVAVKYLRSIASPLP